MRKIILDCSATLSWLMPDEICPDAQSLLDLVVKQGAYVPNLWFLEVANSLLVAVKRKRIKREQRVVILSSLKDLLIEIDPNTADYAFSKISDMAEAYQLTVYDASYLELAIRLKGILATMDNALIKVANKLEIPLYFN